MEYKPKIVEIRFTKEELRKYKESYEVDEHTKMAIQALEEVQQYREIGTLEECRTAREKQIPMKPDFTEDKTFTLCPCCNGKGLLDKQKYCDNCGQKLDWSEESEVGNDK